MAKASAKVTMKRSTAARAAAPRTSAGPAAPRHQADAAPRRPQKFTVSHLDETDFKGHGLRRYAQYRDLGIAQATDGMVQAHVIRFVPPCRPEEVSKLHLHDVDFQMIYVLKGWMKSEFEGEGAVLMRQGTCWIQPPRIKHKVLDYSDDCEVLEIVLPADFATEELE